MSKYEINHSFRKGIKPFEAAENLSAFNNICINYQQLSGENETTRWFHTY